MPWFSSARSTAVPRWERAGTAAPRRVRPAGRQVAVVITNRGYETGRVDARDAGQRLQVVGDVYAGTVAGVRGEIGRTPSDDHRHRRTARPVVKDGPECHVDHARQRAVRVVDAWLILGNETAAEAVDIDLSGWSLGRDE
jgi:hypothetical protein